MRFQGLHFPNLSIPWAVKLLWKYGWLYIFGFCCLSNGSLSKNHKEFTIWEWSSSICLPQSYIRQIEQYSIFIVFEILASFILSCTSNEIFHVLLSLVYLSKYLFEAIILCIKISFRTPFPYFLRRGSKHELPNFWNSRKSSIFFKTSSPTINFLRHIFQPSWSLSVSLQVFKNFLTSA